MLPYGILQVATGIIMLKEVLSLEQCWCIAVLYLNQGYNKIVQKLFTCDQMLLSSN